MEGCRRNDAVTKGSNTTRKEKRWKLIWRVCIRPWDPNFRSSSEMLFFRALFRTNHRSRLSKIIRPTRFMARDKFQQTRETDTQVKYGPILQRKLLINSLCEINVEWKWKRIVSQSQIDVLIGYISEEVGNIYIFWFNYQRFLQKIDFCWETLKYPYGQSNYCRKRKDFNKTIHFLKASETFLLKPAHTSHQSKPPQFASTYVSCKMHPFLSCWYGLTSTKTDVSLLTLVATYASSLHCEMNQ